MTSKQPKDMYLIILQNIKNGQRFLTGKYFSIEKPHSLGKHIEKIYGKDVVILKQAEWSKETFLVNKQKGGVNHER